MYVSRVINFSLNISAGMVLPVTAAGLYRLVDRRAANVRPLTGRPITHARRYRPPFSVPIARLFIGDEFR